MRSPSKPCDGPIAEIHLQPSVSHHPLRFTESHAMGAPFYHISGNTAKSKMRHLCELFCTSCNISHHNMIEQCYLNVIYISERDVVDGWKEEWTDTGQILD